MKEIQILQISSDFSLVVLSMQMTDLSKIHQYSAHKSEKLPCGNTAIYLKAGHSQKHEFNLPRDKLNPSCLKAENIVLLLSSGMNFVLIPL